MTVTPLKPETGKGYVITKRQASEKPEYSVLHCNITYIASHNAEQIPEFYALTTNNVSVMRRRPKYLR
jgi:hypothetical protein